MRSYYQNPIARMEPLQRNKTFRVFSSALSAAHWLRTGKNAERVTKCARGKMKIRTWADGHVVIEMYGAVPKRPNARLAPARHLTPAAYQNENYERLQRREATGR